MVLTLYLMGREVFCLGLDVHAGLEPEQQITRAIGFAAAELSDAYEDLDRSGLGRGQQKSSN